VTRCTHLLIAQLHRLDDARAGRQARTSASARDTRAREALYHRAMDHRLAGKVAIVTGGASGIGRALGEELASRGCEVVLADRQIALAREVEDRIVQRGGKAAAIELDVRDLDAFQRVVTETVRRSHRIDFLFNNAGIGVGGEIAGYRPEDFDDVFDVNLRGVAHGIQTVYPVMIAQRSGHIVNTASVAGLVATPGGGSYTATKHAVVALSKALRMEAVRYDVRVSALCPGSIRTPILTGGRYGRLGLEGASAAHVMKAWERTRPMAPEVFARRAVDRVLANDAIIVLPRWWKALWYLDRISPSLAMAFCRKLHESLRGELEAQGVSFERSASARRKNGGAGTRHVS
jgi:NAD(P)-dependent dehydrogenase (short-subunit alcohol dehydrogenase family)